MTRADICCEIIIIKLIKNPRRFSSSRSEEDKITISMKNFFGDIVLTASYVKALRVVFLCFFFWQTANQVLPRRQVAVIKSMLMKAPIILNSRGTIT